MKRMIDGIIHYSVARGYLSIINDTEASVGFNFPKGYWPIALSSKSFSVLPGRIDPHDTKANEFRAEGMQSIWLECVPYAAAANIEDYAENTMEYRFKTSSKVKRDALLTEFFGKEWNEESTEFIIPVSMVLVPFDGTIEL